jgi:predicted aconitase with swiveling domain
MNERIYGRPGMPGIAEGEALVTRETIQGWSGVDEETGLIVETGHPFKGRSIKGSILILSGGKGSNGWSCHFHAAKLRGVAPAGFVFPKIDSRTGVTAVVTGVPSVVDVGEQVFDQIHTGDLIRVNGTEGYIEIIKRAE